MKVNGAEIIKQQTHESGNLKTALSEARMHVQSEQREAQEAEEEARQLELQLMEAQAAHERKEEAERKGKETSEKIAELTG